jgi:hypothetical protein
MMTEMVQQILAVCAVLAATSFITKHYYDKYKVKTGCATCKLTQVASRPRTVKHTN